MTSLATLILVVTIAMLLLVGGVVFFVVLYQRSQLRRKIEIERFNAQKQLDILQATISGEEEERQRIASELHDDVGATLSYVKIYLSKPQLTEQNIAEVRNLVNDTMTKIRNLSHKLQPDMIKTLGLAKALEQMSQTITHGGQLSVNVINKETVTERLPFQTELAIYRVTQELVTNIIKYANAKEVNINLNNTPQGFALALTHNGKGLTQAEFEENVYKKGSLGLKNIVNRLANINAKIVFSLNQTTEYSIVITVPHLHTSP